MFDDEESGSRFALGRRPMPRWKPEPRPWYERLPPLRVILPVALAVLLLLVGAVGIARLAGGRGANIRSSGTLASATATALATQFVTSSGTPSLTGPAGAVPTAIVSFGVGQPTSFTQQCSGTQPLAPLTLTLDNSHSTISVDWWLDIRDSIPGGHTPWAVANPPYGTLPAGQTATVSLTPDSSLCNLLVGRATPITYHAFVDYAGLGQVTVTDSLTPPV